MWTSIERLQGLEQVRVKGLRVATTAWPKWLEADVMHGQPCSTPTTNTLKLSPRPDVQILQSRSPTPILSHLLRLRRILVELSNVGVKGKIFNIMMERFAPSLGYLDGRPTTVRIPPQK